MTIVKKNRIAVLILLYMLGAISLYAQTENWDIKQPEFLSQPNLNFPNEAIMGSVVGRVWVKIFVGVDGIPIKTDIIKRDPEMAYLFDNNARKWGMQCRFTPAIDKDGNPVSTWIVVPLSFKLDHFTPATCVTQAVPIYPKEALEMGMEGWVGLAVLIKGNGEVDLSQIIVVAREPENTSVFEKAAKEAAYHSRYQAAGYESNAIEGWCFVKVAFNITASDSKGKQN
jgi:outer membrane biosynthesis protein TonB